MFLRYDDSAILIDFYDLNYFRITGLSATGEFIKTSPAHGNITLRIHPDHFHCGINFKEIHNIEAFNKYNFVPDVIDARTIMLMQKILNKKDKEKIKELIDYLTKTKRYYVLGFLKPIVLIEFPDIKIPHPRITEMDMARLKFSALTANSVWAFYQWLIEGKNETSFTKTLKASTPRMPGPDFLNTIGKIALKEITQKKNGTLTGPEYITWHICENTIKLLRH